MRPPLPNTQEDAAYLDQLAQHAATMGLPEDGLGDGQDAPVLGSHPDHFGQPESDPTTAAQPPPQFHDETDLAHPGLPLGSTMAGMDGHDGTIPGTQLAPDYELIPEPAESVDPKDAARAKAAAAAMYGSDFPLLKADQPSAAQWVAWARSLWERHRAGLQKTLHLVERNRLMRGGDQWVTSQGIGPWREPPKPRDAVRAVENMIAPALDQRVQILREQTPGFRTRPTTQDPSSAKKAEAQQMALEYSYHEQSMAEVLAEAAYWCGTDGVCFLGPYWHPDVGPASEMSQKPQGDVRTCVYRIEQVRVSANATSTHAPHYWILRETIPTAQAVSQHGIAVVDTSVGSGVDLASSMGNDRLGIDTPGVSELYREQETVDRYTVYCDRSEFLPQGLTLITCGEAEVVNAPLLYNVVPVIRMTDGSTDPAFFPVPVMNGWVAHQMRINALISKWIESIRVNAGGRFLMKSGTTATETLVGGTTSFLEVKGAFNQIGDVMQPVQGFSVGQDVKDALEREIMAFEQRSGWNDASRGSFSSDQSGRAILAVREQLERVFAPGVASAAHAMSLWAEAVLHIYKVMMTAPRLMGITGSGRPDLARMLTAEDFDGVSQVEIDPETLMPMPRSLRLYLLDQLYQTQVITAQEYRRRLPFAFTGSITTPDDGQEARAQRIADAMLQGQPAPEMRWTDNESIGQDVLERQILLQDSLDPSVVQVAMQRWTELAQQAAMKQGGGPPMPSPQGKPPHDGHPIDPAQAPLPGQNSSVATPPIQLGQSDQQQAALGFDATSPH